MKALMGVLAKKIRGDRVGRQALRDFLAEGQKDDAVIRLSNGKKYRVSRHNPNTERSPA